MKNIRLFSAGHSWISGNTCSLDAQTYFGSWTRESFSQATWSLFLQAGPPCCHPAHAGRGGGVGGTSPTPPSLPVRQRWDVGVHWSWVLALPASCTRLADGSGLLELCGSGYWAWSSCCCCQAEALGEAFLDSFEWEPGALSLQEKIHEVRKHSSVSSGSTLGLLAWHVDPSPPLSRRCSWNCFLLAVSLNCCLTALCGFWGV